MVICCGLEWHFKSEWVIFCQQLSGDIYTVQLLKWSESSCQLYEPSQGNPVFWDMCIQQRCNQTVHPFSLWLRPLLSAYRIIGYCRSIEKALIRLCSSAGWSGSVLICNTEDTFSFCTACIVSHSEGWAQDYRKSDDCFSPNLITSPWRRYEDYNISFCKQWKFRCHCSYEQWHLNLHCLQRGPSCP